MQTRVKLGLKENRGQFALLVLVNAFVGSMVGIERTVLPLLAKQSFGIEATSAALSFITAFGATKAVTNYLTGRLANRFGRKQLLVAGWILGLPVPLLLMYAPSWGWVVAANVLLGMHQGLTWSTTVLMKIDLVGPKQRGLAMGLNEFAGYLAVAVMAFVSGWIATEYGPRPYPFAAGLLTAVLGLLISIFWVKDTRRHATAEGASSSSKRLPNIFWHTSLRNANLSSVTQAGLVNNLNDGMMWGLLPIIMAHKGFDITKTGWVAAAYPAVWGLGQLVTGRLADRHCKRNLIFSGMMMQGLVILMMPFAGGWLQYLLLAAGLGWGTAMVYPTFLASIAENTHPADRAAAMGTFRFWRDLGYAIGALLSGLTADWLGLNAAVWLIGIITAASALVVGFRMHCASNEQEQQQAVPALQ
jgi:MFS family permease